LLCAQQRYDAALQCLSKAPTVSGYWKAALQLSAARVHLAAGQPTEARDVLRQTLAIPGLSDAQRAECEQLLAKLK
jgi:Tfp pilus assembly protein PilF